MANRQFTLLFQNDVNPNHTKYTTFLFDKKCQIIDKKALELGNFEMYFTSSSFIMEVCYDLFIDNKIYIINTKLIDLT